MSTASDGSAVQQTAVQVVVNMLSPTFSAGSAVDVRHWQAISPRGSRIADGPCDYTMCTQLIALLGFISVEAHTVLLTRLRHPQRTPSGLRVSRESLPFDFPGVQPAKQQCAQIPKIETEFSQTVSLLCAPTWLNRLTELWTNSS